MPQNSCRILVVDYDPDRAAPIARALSQCGFRITVVPSAADALEMCRNPDQRVDLVLTRIVLEPMTGLDLAEAIESEKLTVKVLLISHYPREILCASDRFRKLSQNFIQDPASSEEILSRITTALGIRIDGTPFHLRDLRGTRPVGAVANGQAD